MPSSVCDCEQQCHVFTSTSGNTRVAFKVNSNSVAFSSLLFERIDIRPACYQLSFSLSFHFGFN